MPKQNTPGTPWSMSIERKISQKARAALARANREAPEFASRFQAAKKAQVLEIYIYGTIGQTWYGEGVAASDIATAIREAGKITGIALRINSPGGSVFEGAAIYTQLKAAGVPLEVRVDGLAASAAFTIAMCGETITIGEAAMMMLHNAWGFAMGESSDMRREADLLDKIGLQMAGIYAKRSGQTVEEVQTMMDAETWLSPNEAVAKGFASSVIKADDGESAKASAANWDMTIFAKAVPENLKAAKSDDATCTCTCPECVAGDCGDCSDPDCDCEGCTCEGVESATAEQPAPIAASEHAAEEPDFSMYDRRLRLAELK